MSAGRGRRPQAPGRTSTPSGPTMSRENIPSGVNFCIMVAAESGPARRRTAEAAGQQSATMAHTAANYIVQYYPIMDSC